MIPCFPSPLRLLAPILVAGWAIGCASTLSISQVLEQGRYADGHRVVVTGEVVGDPEEPVLGYYFYEIQDGTGRISVQARQPPPPRCRSVRVQGKVGSAFAQETNRGRPGVVYARWWAGLGITESSRQDLGPSPQAQLFGCDEPSGSPRAAVAAAVPAPESSCAAPAYHALDFWIGRWKVKDVSGQPAGISVIEPVAEGCGLLERWTGEADPRGHRFVGAALHLYDPARQTWRQTWTDNRPAITELKGTNQPSGFIYTWEVVTPKGDRQAKRYTLSKTATGVRQLGEHSVDGGATWVTDFDYFYEPA